MINHDADWLVCDELLTQNFVFSRSEQSIFVVGINPSGAAGQDGRIKVGDQVLEVNGTVLNVKNNHQLASNVIKNAPSKLQFVLLRLVLTRDIYVVMRGKIIYHENDEYGTKIAYGGIIEPP